MEHINYIAEVNIGELPYNVACTIINNTKCISELEQEKAKNLTEIDKLKKTIETLKQENSSLTNQINNLITKYNKSQESYNTDLYDKVKEQQSKFHELLLQLTNPVSTPKNDQDSGTDDSIKQ